MKEAFGNIWDMVGPDDILVITTNGFVRKDGSAVMGRGIAYQATQRDLDVAARLGILLQEYGNHVHIIHENPLWLSFPVKHHWKEQADIELIERSTKELTEVIQDEITYKHWKDHNIKSLVYLPRPGCGNGRLSWNDVRPVIEPYLDDRFVVVTNAP